MSEFDNDIVKDVLRRCVEAAQKSGRFDDTLARQIEREARADWAGVETYVRHGLRDRIMERNERIQQLYDGGLKDIRQLATRAGLSVKQVRRIISR